MKIPIDKIVVSGDNPRQTFDEEGLLRLGESIKTHGLLQPIIVRPKGSMYELVVGERRLRASALIGLSEIEAKVEDLDDSTCMELRLIENCHREDLTDAEKGDAVYALWANYDKYETIKSIAETINIPYGTVRHWTKKSRKISSKVKECRISNAISEDHVLKLIKYPHSIQNKLLNVILKHGLNLWRFRDFIKLYDANPDADLDKLANEALGIKLVPKSMLTEEQLKKLEEKRQFTKVKRIRKKPSKPLTKKEVKKKISKSYKFEQVKVSIGKKGTEPPPPKTIEPTIIPLEEPFDYSLCRCSICPLYGKHCQGRCWS